MTLYIDSNVFIFAAVSNEKRALKARELIRKVILGELKGITSSLTIDEVVWTIWKTTKDRNIAIEEGIRILQFNNLMITNVDKNTIRLSLSLMKQHKSLKPRDAVHLAAALSAGVSKILTDDSDFDNIYEIKRIPLD